MTVIKYKKNPFGTDLVSSIHTKKRRKLMGRKKEIVVDRLTGEVTEQLLTKSGDSYEIDSTKFIKVYYAGLDNLFNLSSVGRRVLSFLIKNDFFKKDSEILIINKEYFIMLSGETDSVYYRGMDNLLKNKILARSVMPNTYYINYNVLFNGNRMKFANAIENQLDEKKIMNNREKYIE
jgi:hypothetical protein